MVYRCSWIALAGAASQCQEAGMQPKEPRAKVFANEDPKNPPREVRVIKNEKSPTGIMS